MPRVMVFYRNRKVAVVGGGDTAAEEALYLSNIAEKVYMIIRKDYMRASKIMQERVLLIQNRNSFRTRNRRIDRR